MRHTTWMIVALVVALLTAACAEPIDTSAPEPNADLALEWGEVHQVGWDIVASSQHVTLITLDAGGHPQARILDATPPDSGQFVIWMGTNRNSAKVRKIENDPRATLYYQAPNGGGYVTLRGRATMVDDPEMKERYWRPSWEPFYPDREAMFVLIRFEPKNGEVVSFADGLLGDSLTWAAPDFRF